MKAQNKKIVLLLGAYVFKVSKAILIVSVIVGLLKGYQAGLMCFFGMILAVIVIWLSFFCFLKRFLLGCAK